MRKAEQNIVCLRGAARRRGVALLVALAVLTAMFLLAVPFAVFMRMQHSSATSALRAARAHYGEAGATGHARGVLFHGLTAAERQQPPPPFPFGNGDVDTPWEFRVTLRTRAAGSLGDGTSDRPLAIEQALGFPNDGDPDTVDGYVRVDGEWMAYSHVTGHDDGNDPPGPGPDFPGATLTVLQEHRGLFGTEAEAHSADAAVSFFPDGELWHLDVEDPQARINVNSAPYEVIYNLLGYLGIGVVGSPPAPGDPGFPDDRQQAIAGAIAAYKTNNWWWQGGTKPLYTPFQSVDMIRSISNARTNPGDPVGSFWTDKGLAPLNGAEMDRLRPYVTVSSTYPAGMSGWMPVGDLEGSMVQSPNDADGDETPRDVANLDDASGVSVGALIRFVWSDVGGTHVSYSTVLSRNVGGELRTPLWDVGSPPGNPKDDIINIDSAAGWVGTPGYVKVEDEWIRYSSISRGTGAGGSDELIINDPATDRGRFGTSPDHHPTSAPVDGDVIVLSAPVPTDFVLGTLEPDSIDVHGPHPINVNTVSDPIILQSVLYGISDGANEIDAGEAETFALNLLAHMSQGDAAQASPAGPPYDFFDGNQGWFGGRGDLNAFLDHVGDALTLSEEEKGMVRDNFNCQTPEVWPESSTVPLCFSSGSLVFVGARASVDDPGGAVSALSPRADGVRLARVYDAALPIELWWLVRSQREFHDETAASEAVTGLLNDSLPEAVLLADPDDWYVAYEDAADYPLGYAMPALDGLNATCFTTALLGLHVVPPAELEDFDLDAGTNGTAAEQTAGLLPDTENTTACGVKAQALSYAADYHEDAGARNVEADGFHATMQPLAVEFWVRPADDAPTPQLLFEIGDGALPAIEDAPNQFTVYLHNGRIVLRVSDQMYDSSTDYRGYVEATCSADFPFEAGVWHHVAVAAVGTFKDEIAMFIDGIYDTDMEWDYVLSDGVPTHDETTIEECYFWPVAARTANRRYDVRSGPGAGNTWPAGLDRIGLMGLDPLMIPHQGFVAIGSTADSDLYEYDDDLGTPDLLELVTTLTRTVDEGERVTFLIPVVQPASHKPGSYSSPADGSTVGFWGHAEPAGNNAFDADAAPAGSVLVSRVVQPASGFFPDYYRWLVIDPSTAGDPPVAGLPDQLAPQPSRWKVFDYDQVWDPAGSPRDDLLSGVLPSGDFDGLYIGSVAFQGELDKLRVTALPTAQVPHDSVDAWSQGEEQVALQDWDWVADAGVTRAVRTGAAGGALAHPDGGTLYPSGGYLLAEGHLYSYQSYDDATGELDGIKRPHRDLTPDAGADVGLAVAHDELSRVIALNFVTTSKLRNDYPGGDDEVIELVDAGQFPQSGYVRIGNEIICYEGVAGDDLTREERYPRAAYGTAQAAHSSGALVRHLPVRHLDRYRAGTDWASHSAYADLDGDVCRVEYRVPYEGWLRRAFWRFREPLESGQKVAVLLRLDDTAWTENPDDVTGDYDGYSEDRLWGTLCDAGQSGFLNLYSVEDGADPSSARWRPVAGAQGVEVRFYFDLSETHPYRFEYVPGTGVQANGWARVPELDVIGVEMVPESGAY